MDHSFFLRAERMLAREPAAPVLDYGLLVAALAAHQSASAGARAAAAARSRIWQRPSDALVELIAGGPAWRYAVRAQSGAFNPRTAAVLRPA